jgi:phenol/toluene 2-monooxygenase (NADH) P4/A4
MPVQAMHPNYIGEVKDRVELFHGNQLIYVGWEQHNMVAAPIALPLPAAMLFGDLIDKVLPTTAYAAHPDWPQIEWNKVEWLRSSEPFKPDWKKSLADNGLGHKALIRFRTPGLHGIAGSFS